MGAPTWNASVGPSLAIVAALLLGLCWGPSWGGAHPFTAVGPPQASYGVPDSSIAPETLPAPVSSGLLAVSAAANPSTVCAYAAPTCVGVPNATTITLTAHASSDTAVGSDLPKVQVLFVVETALFDGPCTTLGRATFGNCLPLGDPTGLYNTSLFFADFEAHSGSMTAAVAAAHPTLNVSFGLVDFYADPGQDDGDGYTYHVDLGSFLNATQFPSALNQTTFLTDASDVDISDNPWRSSAITALYGGLQGEGVSWSTDAHHVIVWIGSTAPNDPHYPQNECVMPGITPSNCSAPTCEPSTTPPGGQSPNNFTLPTCEGWVVPTGTNASASLPALAQSSLPCVSSWLSECTIDTITLPTALSDPASATWDHQGGSAQRLLTLQNNSAAVLAAGCDLANATNGSWAGPVGHTCPNGQVGSIPDDVHNVSTRAAQNQSLVAAVGSIALGLAPGRFAIVGRDGPLFQFTLPPAVRLAPAIPFLIVCENATGSSVGCDPTTQVTTTSVTTMAWNWSADPAANGLPWGYLWSVQFSVVVDAPPNTSVPIEVCQGPGCVAPGDGTNGSGVDYVLEPESVSHFIPFPSVEVATVAPTALVGSLAPEQATVEAGSLATFAVGVGGGAPAYHIEIDFGDGSLNATLESSGEVAHIYTTEGSFHVTATVSDAAGSALPLSTFLYVLPALSLTLQVPAYAVVGEAASFTATVTGGLPAYLVSWDFGDGGHALGPNTTTSEAEHSFGSIGVFRGMVVVVDATGASAQSAFTVAVAPVSPSNVSAPLRLNASANVGTPPVGVCGIGTDPVALIAEASGGNGSYGYEWLPGDGSPAASGPELIHRYSAGTFTAWATVVDSSGNTVSASTTFVVPGSAPPPGCQSSETPFGTFSSITPLEWVIVVGVVLGAALALLVRVRSRQ